MNNTYNISACILALNEEKYLQRCLDSVKKYCNEILVSIDSKTTDNTLKIAEDNGCKIFTHDIKCGINQARNNLLANAKGDWILTIDCDETIEQLEINNNFDCYIAEIRLTENGKSHSPMQSFRLWRNGLNIKYYNSNHSRPDRDCLKFRVGEKGLIINNNRDLTEEQIKEKLQRLHDRARLELSNTDNHDRYLDYARSCMGVQKFKEAVDYLFLSISMTSNTLYKAQIFNFISECYLHQGLVEFAIIYAGVSTHLKSQQIRAYYLLALSYKIIKDTTKFKEVINILINNNKTKASVIPGDNYLTEEQLNALTKETLCHS